MLSAGFATVGPLAVAAHEFWIEPDLYQVDSGALVVAQLRNGEKFEGVALGYFDRRTTRFERVTDGKATPIAPRIGDIPAINVTPDQDGLMILIHETAPSTLSYKSWAKFRAFADHKGFDDIERRHADRGLPTDAFKENFTRHAKALVGVGDGPGSDRAFGLETEFVAGANPYIDNLTDGFPVLLHYRGAPRLNAQIEMFEKTPDGAVTVTLHRTDDKGRARLPVKPGHSYLLDAVVLRPAPESDDAVWETLWATLSFAVP